jgi:hypothetical protein
MHNVAQQLNPTEGRHRLKPLPPPTEHATKHTLPPQGNPAEGEHVCDAAQQLDPTMGEHELKPKVLLPGAPIKCAHKHMWLLWEMPHEGMLTTLETRGICKPRRKPPWEARHMRQQGLLRLNK